MRPRKRDWNELENAMPGVVPSGQDPRTEGALYSVDDNLDGTWSIIRGSLRRPAAERVIQRMEIEVRGSALEISLGLEALGFELPLHEQWVGELDLPTPKDIYFESSCARLPGRYLAEAGTTMRIGISITAARRKGWKLHFIQEPEEDDLFSGGYFEAIRKGEFPPVQVLGGYMGRSIGSRHYGVIRDEDLDEVLAMFDVDPAKVFGLAMAEPKPPARRR